ncbi:MAG: chemotaxis protein CheW [Cyanobacteria bacterium P01_F01_bin.150]
MIPNPLTVENDKQLLELAKQGVPEAIALIMNYYFHSKGIDIKVGWDHGYLLIVCDSHNSLDKDSLIPIFERILVQLGICYLDNVTIYGRLRGDSEPLWSVSLDLNHLVPTALTDWLKQGQPSDHSPRLSSQIEGAEDLLLQSSNHEQGHRFLRFTLDLVNESMIAELSGKKKETALLPLEKIQEVLNIFPKSILPVPHTLDFVLGIYNYRGSMLWIVDLNRQLGDQSILTQARLQNTLSTIILCHDDERIGLVVPHVLDIETYALEEFCPPDLALFLPKLHPFIQTYLPDSLSPVLDTQALVKHNAFQMQLI